MLFRLFWCRFWLQKSLQVISEKEEQDEDDDNYVKIFLLIGIFAPPLLLPDLLLIENKFSRYLSSKPYSDFSSSYFDDSSSSFLCG